MLQPPDVGPLRLQLHTEFAGKHPLRRCCRLGPRRLLHRPAALPIAAIVMIRAATIGRRRQFNALVAGDGSQELVNLRRRVFPQHIHRDAVIFRHPHQLAAPAVMVFGSEQHTGAAQFADDFRPRLPLRQRRLHLVPADAEQKDARIQPPGAVAAVGIRRVVKGRRGIAVVGVRFPAAAMTPAAGAAAPSPCFPGGPGRRAGLALPGRHRPADAAVIVHPPHFGRHRVPPQPLVNHLGHILMHRHFVARLNFHYHIKSGRRLAFQHRLLRAAKTRLLVAQRHRLYPANQVGQRGVHNQIVQRVPVGRSHQLHPPLGNSSGGGGLLRRPHLVNDDDLRHMILHRLNHHPVLLGGRRHLHPPGVADGGMGNVPVPGNFVGSVHDDNPLARLVGQHPRHLPQHRRLAHPGAPQQQDIFAAVREILNHLDGAENGAPHPAGDAHHAAAAVADGRNAMQRPFHTRPVVAAEMADAVHNVLQIGAAHRRIIQHHIAVGKARLRRPAQIQDNLQQVVQVLPFPQRRQQLARQRRQQLLQFILGQLFDCYQTMPSCAQCPAPGRNGALSG